ncbi:MULTISPECIES: DUF732 domain-containing protein [unclassified Rhodococcus (in: high G+C Gram-positive bacteria)]|uniref:DUF732 domain-containing protein n=1 Tax=unclassified Rhodococcus (in: high G+C Gram-positive bacteria) TaxID=192944 RepID=UPI000A0A5CC8|nr:DUF732 domain-containing protein [Rhodococcus sp. 1168]ORI21140.1 hypothetical protein BJI47_16970 [Rhodococcus sp. 1168]
MTTTLLRTGLLVAVGGSLLLIGCGSDVEGAPRANAAAVEQIASENAEQEKQGNLDRRYIEVTDDHKLWPSLSDDVMIERGRFVCERIKVGDYRPNMLEEFVDKYGFADGVIFMSDSMDVYCPEELGVK